MSTGRTFQTIGVVFCLWLLRAEDLPANEGSKEKVKLSFRFEGVSQLRMEFSNEESSHMREGTPDEPRESKLAYHGWASVQVTHPSDRGVHLENKAQFFELAGKGGIEGTAVFWNSRWSEDLKFYSEDWREVHRAVKEDLCPSVDILDRSGLCKGLREGPPIPYLWLWLPPHEISVGERWQYKKKRIRVSYLLKEIAHVLGQRCAVIEAEVDANEVNKRDNVRFSETGKTVYHFAIDKGYILKARTFGNSEFFPTIDSTGATKRTQGESDFIFYETDSLGLSPRKAKRTGWSQRELRWSPDGRLVATQEVLEGANVYDSEVRATVWDTKTRKLLSTFGPVPGEIVRKVGFSPKGNSLVVVSYIRDDPRTARMRLLEPRSLKEELVQDFKAETEPHMIVIDLTADGKLLLRSGNMQGPGNEQAWMFDLATLRKESDFLPPGGPVALFTTWPGNPGKIFISTPGKTGTNLALFDRLSRTMKVFYEGSSDYVGFVASAPSGVLIGNEKAQVRVFDSALRLKTLVPSVYVPRFESIVEQGVEVGRRYASLRAGYSADGKRILVLWESASLSVFDTSSWKEIAFVAGHPTPVTAFAWHPTNSRVFVTGSADGRMTVWKIQR